MSRYTGWRQLSGDTAARPDLLDYGKKLLGYLDNQRQLSGVKTLSIERTTPDGSVVRARWDFDIPSVEVIASQAGGGAAHEFIDGFIVRPSASTDQYANTSKNHVVLQRNRAAWSARFYNAAAVPVDYDLKHGFYGQVPPLPDLFPDGLADYGAVDWRNADETLMVTFHGPESRYFGAATDYKRFVFYKAQKLLDLNSVTLLADPNGQVRGACLRSGEGGHVLQVIAQYPESSANGFVRREALYRFRVSATEDAKRKIKPDTRFGEFAALEADLDSAELLATWSLEYQIFGEHPWCFNQAGTEARCIRYRYDDADLLIEAVVNVDEATHVMNTSPLPTSTKAVTTGYTAQPTPVIFNFAAEQGRRYDWNAGTMAYDIPNGMVQTAAAYTDYDPFGVGTPGSLVYGDSLLNYSQTEVDTPASEWVACAVDYRDNVPVYAYSRILTTTTTITQSRAFDPAVSFSYTYGPDTDHGSGNWTYVNTTTAAYSWNSTYAYRRTVATSPQAIRTDWCLHESTPRSVDQTMSLVSSRDETAVATRTNGPSFLTKTVIVPSVYAVATVAAPVSLLTVISGTNQDVIESLETSTDTNLYLWYLDLRYKLLATLEKRVESTRTLDSTWTRDPDVATPPSGQYDTAVVTETNADVAFQANDNPVEASTVAQTVNTTAHPSVPIFSDGGNFIIDMPNPFVGPAPIQTVPFTSEPGSNASYTVAPATVTSGNGAYYEGTIPQGINEAHNLFWINHGRTADYATATSLFRSSGWQAYKGDYCYTLAMPYFDAGSRLYKQGIGKIETGAAASKTITELTGALTAEVRFFPVSVLTPTTPPR